METAMLNEVRDTSGKFAPKSEVPRKVRSVNLTDDAWQWLAAVAEKAGVSRNDYLEALAEGSRPFMEMVKPQTQPLMETVATKRKVDGANIEKQPDTEFYPFIETVLTEVESVKLELEAVRAENQLLVSKKNQEISELNSRLAAANQKISELDDHTEDLESENQNLKSELASRPGENSVPIAIELPEAADLLNQLKGRLGKKCKAGLADIATILDILEGKR